MIIILKNIVILRWKNNEFKSLFYKFYYAKITDCDAHPKDPENEDIGIFASQDPVAVDQACIDAVYNHPNPKKKSLIDRIESKNGLHILKAAEQKGLGSRRYELIECIIESEDIFK